MTDIPGNSSTFASLAVGSAATDSLETIADHDWYRISLTAGQAVTVAVNLLTLEDSYLNIRDSSGNIIYSNDDIVDGVERGSRISFDPSYTGTYYIDVGAWDDRFTGTYQVSVQPYSQPPIATNDQIAAQLVSGFWGGDSHHFNVTQGGTITVNISTLKVNEQLLARTALQEWADIIGVHFQEVATGGQIVFDDSEDSSGPIAATDASYSAGITSSAHVHISSSWVSTYGGLGTYSQQTYVHEIGHALGLGHAGNYNNTADFPYDASFLNDAWSTSIMSYFDQRENTQFNGLGFTRAYAVTPMPADILAMQRLYGLSTTTRTGDTTYGYNSNAGGIYDKTPGQIVAFTIFDNGGNDTLDFSGNSQPQLINLNPETYSNVYGLVGNLTIARGTIIENAIGGNYVDTIIGNSADNVITGNLGPDTMTGGAGNDTFRDTEAGHSGDTITDFGAGDKIVFTDANLSNFSFSLSGHVLSFTGGSLTLTTLPSAHIVASPAASGGVQLTIPKLVQDDFNGDGRSDVLLRNDSGLLTEWNGQANGGFVGNANANIQMDTSWHVAGTADFNGDGYSDILWRNDNGVVGEWNGQASGGFVGNSNANMPLGNDWHVAGTGDFNGDGFGDILWRNDNGVVGEWQGESNGGFVGDANANILLTNDWHVAGTGDFNGDGISDILWRNDNGLIGEWQGQSNGGFVGDSNANIALGNDWHAIGTGDFNGDGISDILWRNDNGVVGEWNGQSNGGFSGNANANIPLGNDWHVAQIGDFNGDASSDILWRATNGSVVEWNGRLNGGFAGNANVNIAVDTHWHVQDPSVHDTLV